MNKEFIPYEQALELKKLGFDEPTSFYWEDNVIRPLPMKDEVCAFHFNRHTRTENEWICAPLYQQAFRWFREKHGRTYEEAELACLNKLIEIVKKNNMEQQTEKQKDWFKVENGRLKHVFELHTRAGFLWRLWFLISAPIIWLIKGEVKIK